MSSPDPKSLLAERLRGGRLDELPPKDTFRIGPVPIRWTGYRTKGVPIVFIAWRELLHIRAKSIPLGRGPHKMTTLTRRADLTVRETYPAGLFQHPVSRAGPHSPLGHC